MSSAKPPPLPPGGPRWQEEGLSISFRACQLRGLSAITDALQQIASSSNPVEPSDISHLDLAENELEEAEDLSQFSSLLSIDISHNSLTEVSRFPTGLLHLNGAYNHLESADRFSILGSLVELNLGYNLLTSVAAFERLTNLQVVRPLDRLLRRLLHPRERNRADPPRLPLCTRGVARSLHVARPQSRTVAPQVLLLPGNRITALHGLAALSKLTLLDLKLNYIEKVGEVRAVRSFAVAHIH